MINSFLIKSVDFYQKYISVLSFGSCRYYPTCSEYAKWELFHNNFFCGIVAIILRILRCNKFFVGGIDYPKVTKKINKLSSVRVCHVKSIKIKFWFIPIEKNQFFIVKSF